MALYRPGAALVPQKLLSEAHQKLTEEVAYVAQAFPQTQAGPVEGADTPAIKQGMMPEGGLDSLSGKAAGVGQKHLFLETSQAKPGPQARGLL